MKKNFVLVLVLSAASLIASAQRNLSEDGAYLCSQRKSTSPCNVQPSRSPNTPQHTYDVQNYTLNFDIYNNYSSPYPQTYNATEAITFKVDTALNQIKLNAINTSLQILSVGGAGISFTHTEDTVYINLNRTYNPGELATVNLSYRHKNVEDQGFYASGGFVFTDSEPEGARKWFPCWDHPYDKATLDLTAKVPNGVKMASNGYLADSTVVADTTWFHWISDNPVATYLMIITSRMNWNLDIVYWPTYANPDSLVPMRFYYNDGENPDYMEVLQPQMATYFSQYYGNHAFVKNGFASLNSEFAWGGMENQTLTSICPGCWYESLICHEFAHQWFGDAITCGTWADIWLNEGFATWSEAFWYERDGGYNAYKDEIEYDASYYLQANPGWAVYVPEWAQNTPDNNTLFNYAITYCKAACELHMLRYALGDDVFFPALYNYATDTVNFRYKNAVTDDFQASFEQSTGQDLDWFFNSWIKQPNHPVYQNQYNIHNNGDGTWNVNFYVDQVQTNAGFFPIPIELYIYFVGATDTTMRVMNSENQQSFSWTFNKQPANVYFDFNNEIVLKQASLTVGIDENIDGKQDYDLSQNYPNPAGFSTEFTYTLPEKSDVQLNVFDMNGKKVLELVNGQQERGTHAVQADVSSLSPGVYYYRLNAGNFSDSKRMVVVR